MFYNETIFYDESQNTKAIWEYLLDIISTRIDESKKLLLYNLILVPII
jgi:hypothetical protein